MSKVLLVLRARGLCDVGWVYLTLCYPATREAISGVLLDLRLSIASFTI